LADAVRVQLLGGFAASSGSSTVPATAWRLRKAKTLVKLLALEKSHRVHRDRIVDALWPASDTIDARNNLHQVVHAARRAFSSLGVDPSEVLAWDGDLLVLGQRRAVVTDIEELRNRVEAARSAGDATSAAQALTGMSGELLPEDEYESWAQPHVRAFREWRARMTMDVTDTLLDAGDAAAVIGLVTPIVAVEPLNEPAHRALMRALAAAGRRSEALVGYERLRAVLRDELGADPEPQTRALFRSLLTAPPAQPLEIPAQRRSSDLPARLTALVGRDRELRETAAILGRTRLLTMTGMGGAGKTTLAVELARRAAAEFPAGAHLVELGSLTAGDQVASRIARTLHIEMPPDVDPVESLVTQLRERRCLLVLDSCEHLVETCARIVSDLLHGCPEMSVLATSREALRIEGEVVWQTPSLELPDPARGADAAELRDIASVQLFTERATGASPAFRLTDDNARAVAEICYRLDGIPLALELAAACIPALAPQQIAERLGDALSLLRRGDRATITRQQTLAATLAWSHDLLTADERLVHRRLAVFAGSFTYDAVEAVCADGLDAGQLLGAVARLVDTSLVVAETRGDVTRYRLLETVRQYAAEQLRAAGEESDLQQRHARHYLAYAEARDPERLDALEFVPVDLDAEQDNLRVAWTLGLTHEPQLSLRISVALWRHWVARGLFTDGRQRLEAVLAATPEPSVLRARALFALGVVDIRRGHGDRLEQLADEAIAIHRSTNSDRGLASALHAAGMLDYVRGDWDQAWSRAEESLAAAAAAGDDHVAAAALHLQAVVLSGRDDTAAAIAALEDVLGRLRALPRSPRRFFPPMMLGFAVDGAGTSGPRVFFEETVLLGRQVSAEDAEGYVLCALADMHRASGDLDAALTMLDDAACRLAKVGSPDGEAVALNHLGCLHRVRKEFASARDAFEQALRMRSALGDRRGTGLTIANLGVLFAAEGDVTRGLARLEEALAELEQTQDRAGRIGVAVTIGSVLADAGDYDAAAAQLLDVLEDIDIPGNHRATAWAYAMLADVQRHRGRGPEADAAAAAAHDRLHALGVVHVLPALQSLR